MNRLQALGRLALLAQEDPFALPTLIDEQGDDVSAECHTAMIEAAGLLPLCESDDDLIQAVERAASMIASGHLKPDRIAEAVERLLGELMHVGDEACAAKA